MKMLMYHRVMLMDNKVFCMCLCLCMQCVWCTIRCRMVCLWLFFCNCLLYDWYTCQYLHWESGNVHVFVLGTMGWAACKNICTTSHSCYGNACCAILRQNKQSGIELTKRHLEDKMHQAQAEVNGMAMASKAEDLNYLSDVAKKEEFGCFPTGCLITCIFDCVSWSSENWRPIWSHCCAPLGSQFNNLKSDCKSVSSLAKDKKKS